MGGREGGREGGAWNVDTARAALSLAAPCSSSPPKSDVQCLVLFHRCCLYRLFIAIQPQQPLACLSPTMLPTAPILSSSPASSPASDDLTVMTALSSSPGRALLLLVSFHRRIYIYFMMTRINKFPGTHADTIRACIITARDGGACIRLAVQQWPSTWLAI